jgi:hypothetical protein
MLISGDVSGTQVTLMRRRPAAVVVGAGSVHEAGPTTCFGGLSEPGEPLSPRQSGLQQYSTRTSHFSDLYVCFIVFIALGFVPGLLFLYWGTRFSPRT